MIAGSVTTDFDYEIYRYRDNTFNSYWTEFHQKHEIEFAYMIRHNGADLAILVSLFGSDLFAKFIKIPKDKLDAKITPVYMN